MVRIPDEAQKVFDEYENTNVHNLDRRIKLLTQFLSMINDLKGMERVIATNQNKLNTLKQKREEQNQQQKKKVSSGGIDPFSVKKGDNIQLTLMSKFYDVGVGKTRLLRNLTGAAQNLVGFFTPEPQVGIYQWKQIPFLLIDAPAIQEGASEGVGNGPKIFSIARQSDLICLCIDLSKDPEDQMSFLLSEFNKVNIRLNTIRPEIKIEKTGSGNIQIFFMNVEAKECIHLKDDIENLCKDAGYRNAKIKISSKVSLNQVIDALTPSITYVKTIIIATKGDSTHSKENFKHLIEKYGIPHSEPLKLVRVGEEQRFHIYPVSIIEESGSEKRKEMFELGTLIFKDLNLMRIYTQSKSGIVADKPIVFLQENVTVQDAAFKVHKDLVETFRYAILYRKDDKIEKRRVGLDFELKDGDIIEIYAKEK